MAKMRRGLAAISSHKSSLTLDEVRRPAPMVLSAKMLALVQKLEAADAKHFDALRESAKQDKQAKADEKTRAAARSAEAKKAAVAAREAKRQRT